MTAKQELISRCKISVKALLVEVKGLEKRLSNVESYVAKIPEITENWTVRSFSLTKELDKKRTFL